MTNLELWPDAKEAMIWDSTVLRVEYDRNIVAGSLDEAWPCEIDMPNSLLPENFSHGAFLAPRIGGANAGQVRTYYSTRR